MTDAARWLDGRRPAVPEELRRAMDRALEAAPSDGPLHDRLAEAALGELERVMAGPGDRSAAMTLLAADALLTAACEAAADAGADALAELLGRLDFRRFSALLERAEA